MGVILVINGLQGCVYPHRPGSELMIQSYLAERFPTFQIEKGFSEEDPLWTADYRETDLEMQVRSRRAFDRVFSEGGASETCKFILLLRVALC
jgi:hypothetical protein